MFFSMNLRALLGRRDWREDASAYIDGELSAKDRLRIEAQLAHSAEMRDYLADLQDMRSVLRAMESTPLAAPFQLTSEMLNDPRRAALRSSTATRALRLSMSTAAIGVATFAAVMVFDVIDSPTVTFTSTSADGAADSVPTASVVTDEVEVETRTQSAAESASAPPPSRIEAVAAAREPEAEESATAASVQVQEESAAQQEAAQQPQQSTQEAYEPDEAEESVGDDTATADPSRRAITAGRAASDAEAGEAASVSAEDVVQQQKPQAAQPALDEAEASDDAAPLVADTESEPTPSPAAETPTQASDPEQSQAAPQTQTETRAAATSATQAQSDWPLEQRPRSSTVRLARDPSWEAPVQIALAVIAISATLLWLVLTIVDRRRQT